jgi:putative PIN family toxin of toxin-antitoxin system
VAEVLARDRIVKRTHMTDREQEQFISALIDHCDLTSGQDLPQAISRDRKDDKFLACAVEGQADYVITGDDDLLVLQSFAGIPITTPRAFVEERGL